MRDFLYQITANNRQHMLHTVSVRNRPMNRRRPIVNRSVCWLSEWVSLLTVARRCYIIRRVLYRYGPRIGANTLRWFTRPRSRTSLVVSWPADIPAISCRSVTFARYIITHWVPCSLQPGIHLLVSRPYLRSRLCFSVASVCSVCLHGM